MQQMRRAQNRTGLQHQNIQITTTEHVIQVDSKTKLKIVDPGAT